MLRASAPVEQLDDELVLGLGGGTEDKHLATSSGGRKRSGSRSGRRGLIATLVISLIVGTGGYLIGSKLTTPEQIAATREAPAPSPIFVPVERRVLETTLVSRGAFEFVSKTPVQLAGPVGEEVSRQIVTRVPVQGQSIEAGAVAFEVAGRPVFALPGDVPMYRTIRPKAVGQDVSQLQSALASLGFDVGPIDGTFGRETQNAVKAWYEANGYTAISPGGTSALEVPAGEVLFFGVLPLRFSEVTAKIGSDATASLGSASSAEITAVTGLAVADAQLLAPGAQVTLIVDGSTQTLTGSIVDIGQRPEAAGDMVGKILVSIEPDDPGAAEQLVGVPMRITMDVATTGNEPVLAAPVTSLITDAAGSTVVWATQDPTVDARPIEVTAGLAANGFVEIVPVDVTASIDENWFVEVGHEFSEETPE